LSDSNEVLNTPPSGTYEIFAKIISKEPNVKLFPCLYVLRMLILRKIPNEHYSTQKTTLVEIFRNHLNGSTPKTALVMTLTLATNMFSFPSGIQFMTEHASLIINEENGLKALKSKDSAICSTAAALMYNYSLYLPKELDEITVDCVLTLLNVLRLSSDEETVFRMLYALGNLMKKGNLTAIQLIASEFDILCAEKQLLQSSNKTIVELTKEIQSELTTIDL